MRFPTTLRTLPPIGRPKPCRSDRPCVWTTAGCTAMTTLSGGEAKRVQIACALAKRPDLLVLDEPTNHVDEPTPQRHRPRRWADSGASACSSRHDADLIDATCGRSLIFERRHVGHRNVTVANVYQGGYTQANAQRRANDERDAGLLRSARREHERLRGAQAERFRQVQHAKRGQGQRRPAHRPPRITMRAAPCIWPRPRVWTRRVTAYAQLGRTHRRRRTQGRIAERRGQAIRRRHLDGRRAPAIVRN